MKYFTICIGVISQLLVVIASPVQWLKHVGDVTYIGGPPIKIPPVKRAAPLDVNNEVGRTLSTLNSLMRTLGQSNSSLVMERASVSITDCAEAGQLQDTESMTCEEFLDALSECDSMANIKPLLKKAKKNYQENPNKKASCFKNKSWSRTH